MSIAIPSNFPVNKSSLDDDIDTSDFSLPSPLESATTSDVQLPIRNAYHYWESVVLLVGGELFKVPRYHLEKGSLFFQSVFASRDEEGTEGRTDEQPIRLDETVTATEFETFLDMLYPTVVPPKESTKSQEAWTAILKISTEWQFPHIRQLAIQALTSMDIDTLTRINLARDYSVSQWLRTGYTDLVKRMSTMTVDEVESIGYLTAIRIFRVREHMIKMYGSASHSFNTDHWGGTTIRDAINEEFLGEIVEVDEQNELYNDPPQTQTREEDSEPGDELYKNLPVGQKFTEATQLAREIEEVKGKDMEESEKEKMLTKLWNRGERRYWGEYNPSKHPATLDVSRMTSIRAVSAVEERLLHLLHPLAKNGDESVKILEVTTPKKPKGTLVKKAINRMLTARNLSSYDPGNPRIMKISLPYKS